MRNAWRAAVVAMLVGAAGQAQDVCRNGLFAEDQAEMRAGRIAGSGRASFYQDSSPGCPQKGEACRQSRAAPPGAEVLVSKVRNGFACVWESHDAVGWIPAAQVQVATAANEAALPAWVDDWKYFDNHLEIAVTADGRRLRMKGRAFWHGIGSTHEGSVEAEAAPAGDHAVFRSAPGGCELRATLVGNRLAVADNRTCGGANVTFGGVYERGHAPFQAESASRVKYGRNEYGQETVEIVNVAYELATAGERRLMLRKTHSERSTIDEPGDEGKITVEAWPLGVKPDEKPLYRIDLEGEGAEAIDNALLVFARSDGPGWWSVYRLDSGKHFFETNAPLASFSITRVEQTQRYVGLEIASDDSSDPRLKARGVVGLLTYASGEKAIREALVVCDNEERAKTLRSLADTTYSVAAAGQTIRATLAPFDASGRTPPTVLTIPVRNDDLDVAHAVVPAGVRLVLPPR